jgi:import inner membrane translocase subunit TIM16|mmetsp:Transcript_3143/g.6531  ORF Transcript_3143/g.6531 Transcript_3143/m.6531 type:complete len:127 (-) Transcript_3143:500-880(-)
MAIGPFARILAQVVVPVVAVLARAIPAAYGQALNNARKAGVDATEAAAPVFGKRITRSEALQVLNITEQEIKADPKIVQNQFERYFAANDVKKQGSFYLQSKIYRAHELLMDFKAEKHKQDVNGGK